MVKYSYYPGNVARQSSQEVEDTIQPLCKTLGIQLIEMVGYNSDGGNIIRQGNRELQLALNARNLAIAQENGHDIMTPCASAQGILYESLKTFREDQIALAKANTVLSKTSNMALTRPERRRNWMSSSLRSLPRSSSRTPRVTLSRSHEETAFNVIIFRRAICNLQYPVFNVLFHADVLLLANLS